VNCPECEELIATAARDGRTLEAAAGHLACCGTCWEFAKETAAIVSALANWRAPVPAAQAMDTAHAALLDRVAAPSRRKASGWRSAPAFLPKQPALLALPGAAAAVIGLAMVPSWAQVAAAWWAAISAALVTVVLLDHGRHTASEGE
jgi:anti-sigma factor ChrR (cupin superfamily)